MSKSLQAIRREPDESGKDPVWALLDASPARRAGGFFSRDVLRLLRLSEESAYPWWKAFLRPRMLAPIALGTCAAAALLLPPRSGREDTTRQGSGANGLGGTDELAEINTEITEEYMALASTDPALLMDEDLLAYTSVVAE